VGRIVVHVVPRAGRTTVAGRHGDAIKIKVGASPVAGAANAELVRFLAERLGVARGAVTLTAGGSSRRKTVTIAGLSAAAAIGALLEPGRPR
jgi:uncharacterized protein (TIGR00251 family)